MDIRAISYEDMNGLQKWLNPNERISIQERLLGRTIYWEIKRDGINLGAYLDAGGTLQLRTRHDIYANPQLREKWMSLPTSGAIIRALERARDMCVDLVIFGEWIDGGRKSPARFEMPEKDAFLVFDIWNDVLKEWMPADERYAFCEKRHIEYIPPYAITSGCTTGTLENIFKSRDIYLAEAAKTGYEGIVGKVYIGRYINFFKEKNEKPPKVKEAKEPDQDPRPELPLSEIRGAVSKVRADLGDRFFDIRAAMPMIAKYVREECEKHECKCTAQLVTYYKEACEEERK